MGFLKPATPGTLLLLVLVTLSTPIIKGIYFLQADISNSTATFGTLGYCIGGTCTAAKLGYDLSEQTLSCMTWFFQYSHFLRGLRRTDANSVFGISNFVPAKYSDALIKGLTYALIVNAVGALLPLLLAHKLPSHSRISHLPFKLLQPPCSQW